jgi:hypothetical protein
MTFMPETHSLLVSAAFLAAFALIALVTLWQVRDLGVYLWTASGLAGALYSTVSAGFPFGPLEELPLLAVLIGTTILASALCKVIAIRLLAGLDPHWRRYAATWAVIAALCAIPLLFGMSVSNYISLVSIAIASLVWLFVREAYRLGREQSLGNAKLLAGLIGAQAGLLLVVGGPCIRHRCRRAGRPADHGATGDVRGVWCDLDGEQRGVRRAGVGRLRETVA